ncbi:MAG: polyisoprenoid-binding protein [Burkholderiales bacterium]|nr:polyisoprenoid-binding protein [Burkholderiales bacterium]
MKNTSLTLLTALAALTATAAFAEPATYAPDPAHTAVIFEARHFGTSTLRVRFDKKSGTVTLDKAAKTGKVEMTIDTSSIDSGTPAFDKHLKSKDFFNVEAFPTATFVSDKVLFDGDKVSAVVGTLTLLGKSQTVTLKANNYNCYQNPMLKREVCGGDFETTVPRSDFGMTNLLAASPNEVRVLIQIEAVKQ